MALLLSGLSACSDGATEDDSADGDVAELSCFDTSPCQRAELGATANNGGADYAAEVVCVLETFRDLLPNESQELEVGTGLLSDSPRFETLVIRADGTVLRQRSSYPNGGSPEVGDVEVCNRQSADYFRDCLEAPSSSCLETDNWFTNCQVETAVFCN